MPPKKVVPNGERYLGVAKDLLATVDIRKDNKLQIATVAALICIAEELHTIRVEFQTERILEALEVK